MPQQYFAVVQQHNMAFAEKTAKVPSSPCPQGWTPPESPTMGSATPHAIMEDLKYLFGMLEKILSGLTAGGASSARAAGPTPANCEPANTPVFQHLSQAGPDMVQLKQLLEKLVDDGYPSPETFEVTRPAESDFVRNEHQREENVQPEVKSQLSTLKFKKVLETYEILQQYITSF